MIFTTSASKKSLLSHSLKSSETTSSSVLSNTSSSLATSTTTPLIPRQAQTTTTTQAIYCGSFNVSRGGLNQVIYCFMHIPFDQTFQPVDSYSTCVNNDFIFIIVGGVVNPAAPDPSTPVAGG